uniref:Uncharacterized protein n=1 Tax=Manihot esculenta TaxID=3983 RepID=A0A2C9W2V9_MANES
MSLSILICESWQLAPSSFLCFDGIMNLIGRVRALLGALSTSLVKSPCLYKLNACIIY